MMLAAKIACYVAFATMATAALFFIWLVIMGASDCDAMSRRDGTK
jgi:hypothetical protein